MQQLTPLVRAFYARREPAALATVVATRGSSYRQPGARRLVFADGPAAGAITGGCLEDEIDALARQTLADRTPRRETFDLLPRFGCAGEITIFCEAMAPDHAFFARAAEETKHRATWHAQTVVDGPTAGQGTRPLARGESVAAGARHWTFEPALRVALIGEGPENAPFAAIARTMGWEVTEVERADDLPAVDSRTAVVVKARKFGRDLAALAEILRLPIPYVGLLGPARRRRELIGALLGEGLLAPDAPLGHLHGPAGLDLGVESPAEIALSIAAEIQAAFGGGSGGRLREKAGGVHGRPVELPLQKHAA